MTDMELRDVCASHGVSYSENEQDVFFKIATSGSMWLSPIAAKKLFLTGAISLQALSDTEVKNLRSSKLFDTDTQTLFIKRFALKPMLAAIGWNHEQYKFAACVYMVYLGVSSDIGVKLDLRGEDFMEDIRMTFIRKVASDIPYGEYGAFVAPHMTVEQKRFMVLWQVFGIQEYHGIKIERFFACFGDAMFEGARTEKIALTNEKINAILIADIESDDDSHAIAWVEKNIK